MIHNKRKFKINQTVEYIEYKPLDKIKVIKHKATVIDYYKDLYILSLDDGRQAYSSDIDTKPYKKLKEG